MRPAWTNHSAGRHLSDTSQQPKLTCQMRAAAADALPPAKMCAPPNCRARGLAPVPPGITSGG